MTHPTKEDFEDHFFSEAEYAWRYSLPRYTPKELIEIFPEAKDIIPEKIEEWEEIRNTEEEYVVEMIQNIKKSKASEFGKWFLQEMLMHFGAKTLWDSMDHIKRLRRLDSIANPKKYPPGKVSEEMIEFARNRSPFEVASEFIQLKRMSGERFIGLCPFHNEKTESFVCYENKKNFFCFGCNRYFDNISFTMEMRNTDFINAVKLLQK